MRECEKLNKCSFVQCCDAYSKSTAARGFINMYCRGSRMDACVRKKLSTKFGREIVPKNMMPNGSPLPQTSSADWDTKAKNYFKYL